MMGNDLMSWRLQNYSSYKEIQPQKELCKGGHSIPRMQQEERGLRVKDFEGSLYLCS